MNLDRRSGPYRATEDLDSLPTEADRGLRLRRAWEGEGDGQVLP